MEDLPFWVLKLMVMKRLIQKYLLNVKSLLLRLIFIHAREVVSCAQLFTLCTIHHLLVEPQTESQISYSMLHNNALTFCKVRVLKRRNQIIVELLGNIFICIAARSRLSPQMA